MRTALRQYLLSVAAVYARFGTRIYTPPAPQGVARPFLTISRIFGSSGLNHAGIAGRADENWQLDVYAETRADADAGAEAVRKALCGFVGDMFGVYVHYCAMTVSRDLTEDEGDHSQDAEYRVSMEFQIVRDESGEDRVTTTTTT